MLLTKMFIYHLNNNNKINMNKVYYLQKGITQKNQEKIKLLLMEKLIKMLAKMKKISI